MFDTDGLVRFPSICTYIETMFRKTHQALKDLKRVRLSDLRSLSPEEYRSAKQICDQIQSLVQHRNSYVKENNLNPEIADPGANWAKDADNAIHNLYNLVVKADYEVLNRLRFYTQPFTGYQLTSMSMGYSKTPVPKLDNAFDEQLEGPAPHPDCWIERYLAIISPVPEEIVPKYPLMLGEIGWRINGAPVSHDTYSYQERLNLLFESGVIHHLQNAIHSSRQINVLEIGGGYGGLAYALAKVLQKGTNYFICDIPESLLFSALYLQLTLPEHDHLIYEGGKIPDFSTGSKCRFIYVPNYMFDKLAGTGIPIALAINTLSLAEMTECQVRYYAKWVKDMIGNTGVFFEQNHDGRWLGLLNCKPILASYFPHRKEVVPKTIPVLSKGRVDFWSNVELDSIIPSARTFFTTSQRIKMFFWRSFWLVREPALGITKLREILQKSISPALFRKAKRIWNKLGGRLEF